MSTASLTAAARRQAQLAFLASGTEFRLGRAEDWNNWRRYVATSPGSAPASTTG